MAFLQLASEVSQPFVIPSLSPVTPQPSRKNSTNIASATTTPIVRSRNNSMSLL
ncbi:uncharacterized protein NDAI_0E04680 [Naumovozyma dairenensis CBS 421]|uniref:Uncharacterized protein n=1 Tax=Naumovozyma dairenensis (strain ATCC 10597 / BCRC 20456 / CBS 421 / NBRC 0211 / NRRL Y-12639) TaxID=1071378 RepID=G0WC15_NAUDC|nr:hypothetical protein NDAI_0E04680 [Naumovozyma dairenensis CBS 421]CCD25285.1 hypothetical protein NDAI_0E04680 [Naumovozyma dairenensis CBS 421]